MAGRQDRNIRFPPTAVQAWLDAQVKTDLMSGDFEFTAREMNLENTCLQVIPFLVFCHIAIIIIRVRRSSL